MRRERLRRSYVRCCGCSSAGTTSWRLDPGDERAHLALMRRYAAAGDRYAAPCASSTGSTAPCAPSSACSPAATPSQLRDRLLRADQRSGRARRRPGRPRGRGRGARRGGRRGRPRTRPHVVVLTGPPGSGKSALLRRTVDRARQLGWRVGGRLRGASIEGAWPYAPLLDAVADLCRRQPTLLDGLADPYRHEIDRVLAGGDGPWTGQSTHQRLFVAVAELLRLASATTGVVVALDDLHDADDATLRLLHYLSRALNDAPLLFLLAHRSPVVGQVPSSSWAGSAGSGRRLELPLGPLPEAAVRTLIARHSPDAPAEQVERIVDLAGGNPYVVIELADAGRRRARVGGRARRPRRRRHPRRHPGGAAARRRRRRRPSTSTSSSPSPACHDDDAFGAPRRRGRRSVCSSRPTPGTGSATGWCATPCSSDLPAASPPAHPPRCRGSARRPRRVAGAHRPPPRRGGRGRAGPCPPAPGRGRDRGGASAPTAMRWRSSMPSDPTPPVPSGPDWRRSGPTCSWPSAIPPRPAPTARPSSWPAPPSCDGSAPGWRAPRSCPAISTPPRRPWRASTPDGGPDDGEILLAQGYTAFFDRRLPEGGRRGRGGPPPGAGR